MLGHWFVFSAAHCRLLWHWLPSYLRAMQYGHDADYNGPSGQCRFQCCSESLCVADVHDFVRRNLDGKQRTDFNMECDMLLQSQVLSVMTIVMAKRDDKNKSPIPQSWT